MLTYCGDHLQYAVCLRCVLKAHIIMCVLKANTMSYVIPQ